MPTKGANPRKSRRASAGPTPGATPKRLAPAPRDVARLWSELRRRGLVESAGPIIRGPETPGYRPVHVAGEPLSETIIRERR